MPADKVILPPDSLYGGLFSTKPKWIVLHTLESPVGSNIAESLATGYFQELTGKKKSVHAVADSDSVVRMVPVTRIAWHCGNGNSISLGIEHAGRAAFTFADWTSPAIFPVLRQGARVVAEWCKQFNIPTRLVSAAEINSGVSGITDHKRMRDAKGGSDHTDVGTGFPWAIYLQMVDEFKGVKPTPTPVPKPTIPTGPQTGGAEGNEMAASVWFRYYGEPQFKEDGTPNADRFFESNLSEFWHIKDPGTAAGRLELLKAAGVQPQAFVNGKLVNVNSIDEIFALPVSPDPNIYGVDISD